MAKSRSSYFDNIKALLIALVVIGHVLDLVAVSDHWMAKAAFIYIYSFHMPLFIFVSGLFCNRDTLTREKAAHRITYFIILGYIAKLIALIVPALFGKPLSFSLLSDSNIPWYLFAMAAFYTLTYLLKKCNAYVVLVISFAVALFVGYDSNIGDFLYLSRIVVFFPFFWLGAMLKPERIESFTKSHIIKVLGVLVVVIFAVFCIMRTSDIYAYRFLFTGRNSFEAASALLENCSHVNRLIAYAISAVMCFGIIAIAPHAKIPVITNMGQRTLQIYLLHLPILNLLNYAGVLAYLTSLPNPGWVSIIALAILVALCLSVPVLSKPFDMLSNALKPAKTK